MKIITLIAFIAITTSCNLNTPTKQATKKELKHEKKHKVKIQVIADKGKTITIGEDVIFTYKTKDLPTPDSIKLSVDYKLFKKYIANEIIAFETKNLFPGNRQLQFVFYWGDTLTADKSMQFEMLSDIIPHFYTFKVLKKWPHNTKSYTQGLEFLDGHLYEGTGNYGESMLYKIDIDKNEVVQSLNLPKEVFGEGITIVNNKIYQLTWRSNTGYAYDKNTLNKLYEFTYPTEGWGLTNNGTELIMSDGSENIYYLDTEFIQETHKLQVYDNKGPIKSLNELEYIGGLIYANVYGTDEIVAFESESGKVVKRIDLSGILNKNDVKTPIDVLNGIAWDNIKKRLIVTGKWWPYFYEIELVEK